MTQSNKIITITPEENYRLIAISDVHGALHLFKELLQKADLRDQDYLVLLGDSIEKGLYNEEMLQYLKELSQRPNTFILMGNWESYLLSMLSKPERAEELPEFIQWASYPSIITAWCKKLGIDTCSITDPRALQAKISATFREDIEFLSSFPLALELDNFIFVHAGVEPIPDWRESKRGTLLAAREFLDQGHCCGKYVVAGHWPVCNYREQSLCNDIIIDHDKKIISIDGGNGVKSTGQLNALIIEKQDGQYSFSTECTDDFTEYRVTSAQTPSECPVMKIDWRDNAIEPLERGREFSLCRKPGTGENFYIKNEFIAPKGEGFICNDDYISRFLDLEAGDLVRVQAFYGDYAFVLQGDKLGWVHRDALVRLG